MYQSHLFLYWYTLYVSGRNDAPAERPRLNLKPRTVDTPPAASTESPQSNKPNPFGAAKPVDTEEALKRIEDKLHKTTISKWTNSGQAPS